MLIAALPYFFSLIVTVVVGIYTWRHRGKVRGGQAFSRMIFLEACWALGFLCELFSASLPWKIFWDDIQYIPLAASSLSVLGFAYTHAGRRLPGGRWGIAILALGSVIFVSVTITNGLHGWLRPSAHLIPGTPFSTLDYDYSLYDYLAFSFSSVLSVWAIGILVALANRQPSFFRWRTLIIVAGLVLPLLAALWGALNIPLFGQRDITPFGFALGNMVIVWGLFRYRLFDVAWIAREVVMEHINDMILVIDRSNQIADLNPPARALVEEISSGEVVLKVGDNLPASLQIDPLPNNQTIHDEFCVANLSPQRYFERHLTPLFDGEGQYQGRLLVLHDVTERRLAQTELEQRVQERTAELSEMVEKLRQENERREAAEAVLRASEERFRTSIEQFSEGFLLIDEQGTVGEWNQAMETITGLRRDEVMGRPFAEVLFDLTYSNQQGTEYLVQFHQFVTKMLGARAIGPENKVTESNLRTRDGQQKIIQRSIFPIHTSSGMRIGAVARDITTQKLVQLTLERLATRMQSLHRLDQAILAAKSPHQIAEAALEALGKLVAFQAAWVVLFDQQACSISFCASRSREGGSPTDIRPFPMDWEWVENLRSQAPETRHFYQPIDSGEMLRLVTPLMMKEELIGALDLYFCEPFSSDADTKEIIWEIASQLAIAMHQAALFAQNQQLFNQLSNAYDATIEGWSSALELRDKETQGHSQRVMHLALDLARRLGIAEEDIVHFRRGVLLHDIGKMGIPDHILLKPGPLNEEEWSIMRLHPVYAYRLLSSVTYLQPALDIPYCHHERWDGSGYPRGLKGEAIPLSARIFAVVDVWDALTSNRPYRPALDPSSAVAYLCQHAGQLFDSHVVHTFLETLGTIE